MYTRGETDRLGGLREEERREREKDERNKGRMERRCG